jgi:hypothetical protein
MTNNDLPDKLPMIAVPMGNSEYDVNEKAVAYNKLTNPAQKKTAYKAYLEAASKADWD